MMLPGCTLGRVHANIASPAGQGSSESGVSMSQRMIWRPRRRKRTASHGVSQPGHQALQGWVDHLSALSKDAARRPLALALGMKRRTPAGATTYANRTTVHCLLTIFAL